MRTLVTKLAAAHPHLSFVASDSFYWCPETSEVFYDDSKHGQPSGIWSLLHEASHGLLGHTTYKADLELLHLEVEAWHHALDMAKKHGFSIDGEYGQLGPLELLGSLRAAVWPAEAAWTDMPAGVTVKTAVKIAGVYLQTLRTATGAE